MRTSLKAIRCLDITHGHHLSERGRWLPDVRAVGLSAQSVRKHSNYQDSLKWSHRLAAHRILLALTHYLAPSISKKAQTSTQIIGSSEELDIPIAPEERTAKPRRACLAVAAESLLEHVGVPYARRRELNA